MLLLVHTCGHVCVRGMVAHMIYHCLRAGTTTINCCEQAADDGTAAPTVPAHPPPAAEPVHPAKLQRTSARSVCCVVLLSQAHFLWIERRCLGITPSPPGSSRTLDLSLSPSLHLSLSLSLSLSYTSAAVVSSSFPHAHREAVVLHSFRIPH